MILKSEGEKIKYCSTPARDRKYVIAAYTNLVVEKPQSFIDDSLKTVVSSLIELARKSPSGSYGFEAASQHQGSAEEMLMDGAIDQTFAFQRQQHIQLHAAKTEQADKLEQQVSNPELYLMQALQKFTEMQQQSISNYLTSEKIGTQLQSLCQATGV